MQQLSHGNIENCQTSSKSTVVSDLPCLWLRGTRRSSGQSCSAARSTLKGSLGGKKEGKVETNLTSQRDLQADERAQRNAPVRDDREQKSYGKENCSCGETKTTTRRVSLLRSGIRFVCLFCTGRSFSLGFAEQNWKVIRFVVTTDSLAVEGWRGAFAGTNDGWRWGRKKFKPHNEWQKIRGTDVISKNSLASGLRFQSLVARTSQAIFSSLLSIYSMCESIKNDGDLRSLNQR